MKQKKGKKFRKKKTSKQQKARERGGCKPNSPIPLHFPFSPFSPFSSSFFCFHPLELDGAAVDLGVPEDDDVLRALRLGEGIHHRAAEIAPFVLQPHIGKVDERVNPERETQRPALPRQRPQALARNLNETATSTTKKNE